MTASEVIDRKIMSAACWFSSNFLCNCMTRHCLSTHLFTPHIVTKVIYEHTSFSIFLTAIYLTGGKLLCIKHREVPWLLHGHRPVNQCQIKWTRTRYCFKNSCELFQPVFRCSCESFSIMARHDFLLSQGLGAHLTSLRSAHQVFDSPRLFSALTWLSEPRWGKKRKKQHKYMTSYRGPAELVSKLLPIKTLQQPLRSISRR